MSVEEQLRHRLAQLSPEMIEIADDTAKHAGHAGAASGGKHFRLLIVAAAFAGQSTLQRQRAVLSAAGDLMQGPIHALSIQAKAPGEV